MTTLRTIPLLTMIISFGVFARTMPLFRHADRASPAKRILVASIYVCALTQLLAVWFSPSASSVSPWIAVGLFAVAQALFWWSLASHGRQRPGFAFIDVEPASLVVCGPYGLVRHPIYTSYLLAWIGGAVLGGQPWLMISVVWMGFLYHRAASQEERLYGSSPLAPSYERYRQRVGMFVPRLRSLLSLRS